MEKKQERDQRYKELGLRDKITLSSGRFLLGNKYASLSIGLINVACLNSVFHVYSGVGSLSCLLSVLLLILVAINIHVEDHSKLVKRFLLSVWNSN